MHENKFSRILSTNSKLDEKSIDPNSIAYIAYNER